MGNSELKFQKEPKNACTPKEQLCSQETIVVLSEAWGRGSAGSELFLAAAYNSSLSRSSPMHTASLSGAVTRDLLPIPSHPSYSTPQLLFKLNLHKPSCSWRRMWIIEGFEFAPTAGCTRQEKGAVTCGFSSKKLWVLAREPCFQEQIKWGNTEPSLKSFRFEETAKKEKRERFHEMSIMVAGRNIKFTI